ncbi:MAG: transcriptional regulator [Omnitrophica WOR_2 bacterium GWA2_47_8]|nr:MAG: transcriptional regulator [Omnitrophica WOR_2 bacterium GWA2_47_8]
MSGHSKWASIKHKKGAADAKRGAAFTKIIREITTAAKDGGDPDKNPRLRTAMARAKFINMPSVNVENAIKKGTGELPGVVYENVTFDAYGPGGVALLIEGLTDNKNRTTAEIRNILSKKNGSLAGAGSTAWMFAKKGFVSIEKDKISEEQLMDIALEAGADDIKSEGNYHEVTCAPTAFEAVKAAIEAKKIPVVTAEITMVPGSTVKVVGNDAKTVLDLLSALEDHEDVQAVHANFDISDEEIEKAAQAAG